MIELRWRKVPIEENKPESAVLVSSQFNNIYQVLQMREMHPPRRAALNGMPYGEWTEWKDVPVAGLDV